MDVKKGEIVIYHRKGDYCKSRVITTERSTEEIVQNKEAMPRSPAVYGIISEIPGHAWIIRCGNRAYLYSGLPGEFVQVAKRAIQGLPENAGSTVKSTKVV